MIFAQAKRKIYLLAFLTAFPMKTGEIQQFVRTLVRARDRTVNNQTRVAGALSKRSPLIKRPGASAEAERPSHPGRPFQDD
ncbi:MAG TPA: hypothetical protein DD473_27320 [Planctomycetaceae bacterium]|nr:hypothetical protein [Planctomycetaceae bacterium]